MNKRILASAVGLTLMGWVICRGDSGYRVKIVDIDRAGGNIMAKFVVAPSDLRIFCKGTDVSNISVGDYVEIKRKNEVLVIVHSDARCDKVMWYPEGSN
jgi:hypothetical protein